MRIFKMRHLTRMFPVIVALFPTAAAITLAFPASAGYYDFPLAGMHMACADGSNIAAAIFPGTGLMLYNWNGRYENAYPSVGWGWAPISAGAALCWGRPMSAQSQRELVYNFQLYCLQRNSYYCRFE